MVAVAYERLGGIASVTNNTKIPYSKRGRDRDRFQTFFFEADPNNPFTGIVHLQGSVDAPSVNDEEEGDFHWVDVVEMDINNEGGSWFFQIEVELANVRVVCKEGNYRAAANGTSGATVTATGNFTIDGITVAVTIGDNAVQVADAINTTAGIISNGTIVADTVDGGNTLRIYNTTGNPLVLADTTNTPLADMGITPGTFTAGRILSIRSMR